LNLPRPTWTSPSLPKKDTPLPLPSWVSGMPFAYSHADQAHGDALAGWRFPAPETRRENEGRSDKGGRGLEELAAGSAARFEE